MPFKSKAQMRACYAKDDPNWDCDEWAEKTKDKQSLPEKKKSKNEDLSFEDRLNQIFVVD